jgi:hypothetical protein
MAHPAQLGIIYVTGNRYISSYSSTYVRYISGRFGFFLPLPNTGKPPMKMQVAKAKRK